MHAWVGSSAHWVYTNLAAVFSWVLDSTSLWLIDLLSTNLFQCILKRCCSYHLRSINIIFKLNADVFVLLDPWFLWTVNYEELGFSCLLPVLQHTTSIMVFLKALCFLFSLFCLWCFVMFLQFASFNIVPFLKLRSCVIHLFVLYSPTVMLNVSNGIPTTAPDSVIERPYNFTLLRSFCGVPWMVCLLLLHTYFPEFVLVIETEYGVNSIIFHCQT